MSNLIGGFTDKQYKAYTNTSTSKQTNNQKKSFKLTKLSCFSFKAFTILINRIGYFILTRLSTYPNNAYLFQKYKSHQFQEIKTQDQWKDANTILCRFKRCPELLKSKFIEIQEVEQELQAIKLKLDTTLIHSVSTPVTDPVIVQQELLNVKEEDLAIPGKGLPKPSPEIFATPPHLTSNEPATLNANFFNTPINPSSPLSPNGESSVTGKLNEDHEIYQNSFHDPFSQTETPEKLIIDDPLNTSLYSPNFDAQNTTPITRHLKPSSTGKKILPLDQILFIPESEEKTLLGDQRVYTPLQTSTTEQTSTPVQTSTRVQTQSLENASSSLQTLHLEQESNETPQSTKKTLPIDQILTSPNDVQLSLLQNTPVVTSLSGVNVLSPQTPSTSQIFFPQAPLNQLASTIDAQIAQQAQTDLVTKVTKLTDEVKQLQTQVKDRIIEIKEFADEHDQQQKAQYAFFNFYKRTNYDYKNAQNLKDGTFLDQCIAKANEYKTLIIEGQTLRCRSQFPVVEFDKTFTPLCKLFKESIEEFSLALNKIYPKEIKINESMHSKYDSLCKALDEAESHTLKGKSTWLGIFHLGVNAVANGQISKPEHYRWKIERYEKLIRGSQTGIEKYILSNASIFGNIETFLNQAETAVDGDWQKQILPILKFYLKNIDLKESRLNDDYLKAVRNCYTQEYLEPLRNAANWAFENPTLPGVEHIHALCYQFYATLDFNDVCKDVSETFLKEGGSRVNAQTKTLDTNKYPIIADLLNHYAKIKAVPNAYKSSVLDTIGKSIVGHTGGLVLVPFDPIMDSNPVHVIYQKTIKSADGIRTVKDIAMGTPTIQFQNNKVEICPLFKGYLTHCQKNGLKHLYINYQDFSTEKGYFEADESFRCQAIHDLAEKEFPGTLFAMTLTQDSSFYLQKGHEFKDLNIKSCKVAIIDQLLGGKHPQFKNYFGRDLSTEEKRNLGLWIELKLNLLEKDDAFKKNLIKSDFSTKSERDKFVQSFHENLRLYVQAQFDLGYSVYTPGTRFTQELIWQIFDKDQKETGNLIPQVLLGSNEELRTWSVLLASKIHFQLFDYKIGLSVRERRIFIRLFYLLLSRKVLLDTQADGYTGRCKDGIDRGAAMEALEFLLQAVLDGTYEDKEVIEFFNSLVFARALIVRKREINLHRLKPVLSTGQFMIDNKIKLIGLVEDLFPNVEFSIDQFPKKSISIVN